MRLVACLLSVVGVSLGLCFGVPQARAVSLINTEPQWNHLTNVQGFGQNGGLDAMGQTFTVAGPETVLDRFSFWVDTLIFPNPVHFSAYLMKWDGQRATGPILYESAERLTTDSSAQFTSDKITFDTGGVGLLSGQQYVAFVSSLGFNDALNDVAGLGYVDSNPYLGGQLVWLGFRASDESQFGTLGWRSIGNGKDLAFTAEFSKPVPEPSSLLLFATGLFWVVAWRLKKFRTQRAKN